MFCCINIQNTNVCYVYIFLNKNVIVILPGTAVQRKGKLFNICMYVFSTFLFLTVLYSFIN